MTPNATVDADILGDVARLQGHGFKAQKLLFDPPTPPAGVYLVWHRADEHDRPYLKTAFRSYEEAKAYCIAGAMKNSSSYDTHAQHGTTEGGGLEHFEVIGVTYHPENEVAVKHRWTIKHLLFGQPL